MQVFDQQTLLKKFAGVSIKVDPFFLRKTGLLTNQTVLRLGEYNLTSIPAYLNFEDSQLLAVLTPTEISLFSKFTTVTNTVIYCFSRAEGEEPIRFHIKVNLLGINPLPDRKNVCLVSLKYKAVPAELVQIVGGFLEEQEDRRAAYEKYAEELIAITPPSAEVLGYNSYAEILDGAQKLKVKMTAFHSKEAHLVLPPGLSVSDQKPLFLKLYFRTSQFTVEGELLPDGVFRMNFSNEIIGIIEDYHFKLSVLQRKKNQQGAEG